MTTNEYLPTAYQQIIYKSKYARWIEEEGRREDFDETVDRYLEFLFSSVKNKHGWYDEDIKSELRESILALETLPSMRAFMTAGPAAERSNISTFNCAFTAVEGPEAFDEALYILMNGTGLGFSVELEDVAKLPTIPNEFTYASTDQVYMVGDSKEGWSYALKYVIESLYSGIIPDWDLSEVRPAGARLKVFGGRASGPEPLNLLLNQTVRLFMEARGRKLTPIECHRLMCYIAEIVVVGGVRRAALISLSDLDDIQMRMAKSGEWWKNTPEFGRSNNSAVYDSIPTKEKFFEEWNALRDSGSGERGIFNRHAARNRVAKIGRNPDLIKGTNPCGEILLRSKQFCNLSSITVHGDDTIDDLRRKARRAAIIGTLQSTLTDFPYLSEAWAKNTNEERLLGVSLNGIFSNPLLFTGDYSSVLEELRSEVHKVNAELADEMGIPRSKAMTTIKPEGSTSQMVMTSSGIHTWFASEYVRRVRGDNKDAMTELLKFYGVSHELDVFNDSQTVFSFPLTAPEGAATRETFSTLELLEIFKTYSNKWTDHNPSITINVRDDEWQMVGEWVYDNFDEVVGCSFLPYDGGSYVQAPYEEVSSEEFSELLESTPTYIPWESLSVFETEYDGKAESALACMSGGCEVDTI
jgi:ribonucleoside-triphosphate reductase